MLKKPLDGQKIPQDMRPRNKDKDILAMAGPMMPPGGAPPAGGGGGDIANQLMQLLEPVLASPKGQMMAQALMSQMGGGGMGGGQMPQSMPQNPMTGNGTDGAIMEGRGMLDQVSGGRPMPPSRAPDYAGDEDQIMDDPRQTPMPSTEDELATAQQMMGGGGGGGGGGGINQGQAPTPQEVQMLQSSPSPRNVANFNKLFGPGAAEAILQGGGGGPPAPPAGGSTYEDDVRGAMDDAE